MRERTSATVKIMRGHITVATVPITESCKRTYTLMSDDSITLDFSLGTAVHFAIGDYCDDELFGRFVIAKEQMPQYDAQTGGYRYTLQLVAEYMTWANRKLMLTATSDGVSIRKEAQWRLTADLETQVAEVIANVECLGFKGYSYSIETSAKLAKEVKLMQYDGKNIIDALNEMAEAWECEWWVSDKVLHMGKCESSGEALTFKLGETVESMTISDNRNTFANKVYVYGSTKNIPPTYRKELALKTLGKEMRGTTEIWHIDKELTEEMFPKIMPIYMPLNGTATVTPRNKTVELKFGTSTRSIATNSTYKISTPAITFGSFYVIETTAAAGTVIDYTISAEVVIVIAGTQRVLASTKVNGNASKDGNVRGFAVQGISIPASEMSLQLNAGTVSAYMVCTVTNSTYNLTGATSIEVTSSVDPFVNIEAVGSSVLKVHGKYTTTSEVTLTWASKYYKTGMSVPLLDIGGEHYTSNAISMESGKTYSATLTAEDGVAAVAFLDETGMAIGWIEGNGQQKEYSWNALEHKDATSFVVTTTGTRGKLKVVSHNEQWQSHMRINALGYDASNEDSYCISFCDEDGVVSTDYTPSALTVGGWIIVDEESTTIRVPSAYYTTEYDNPSALAAIGEARLQMPAATGGYLMASGATEANAVEEVVIFEDIYPRCDLVVASVDETRRTDRTEYAGEDATANWQWTEYTLTLEKANGEDFPFSDEYMLSGATLQIKFLTNDDMQGVDGYEEQEDGCKLAGMTFDVEFRKTGEYIIGRNEEYGAKLPNDVLRPNVGDPCILIGFNSRAIDGLGLIEDAEEKLQDKAEEYIDALEEGQFTFDCSMMSDFAFDQIPYLALFEAEDKQVKDYDDKYIWVKNGHSAFLVPIAGARVSITHSALASTKTSRIIGYELKLDKPYDTPRYIVGETDAYSRLAKIERELNKK